MRGETGTVRDYWCDPGHAPRRPGAGVSGSAGLPTPKRYSRLLHRVMYMSALTAIGCGPASRAASTANETEAIGSWSWTPDAVAPGADQRAWVPQV
jgi:hypothetical protein